MRSTAALSPAQDLRQAVRLPQAFVVVGCAYCLIAAVRAHEIFRALGPLRLGMISTILVVILGARTIRKESFADFLSTPVGKGLIVCLVMAVITIPTAEWPKASVDYVRKVYYQAVILLVVATFIFSEVRATRVMIIALVASVTFAGIKASLFGIGRFEIGQTYDANETAALFVLTIPWAISLLLTEKGPVRLLGLAALPVAANGILATGSRGGLLAAGALVPFLVYLSPPKRRAPFILCVVVGAVLTVGAMGEQAIRRFQKAFDTTEYNYTTQDGRMEIWKRGLSYIQGNPVLGVGIDGFQYKELATKSGGPTGAKQSAAHNMYIQVAAELGLIGFGGFLAMLLGGLRLCSVSRTRAKQRITAGGGPEASKELIRANMAQASLLSVMFTGFFLSMGYSAMVYFSLGAAVGTWMRSRQTGSISFPGAGLRQQAVRRVRGMRGWRSARPIPAASGVHPAQAPYA